MPKASQRKSKASTGTSKPTKGHNRSSSNKPTPPASFAKDSPEDIMVQVMKCWQEIDPRLEPKGPPHIVPEEQSVLEERRRISLNEMRRMQANVTTTTDIIMHQLVPRGIAARDVWKILSQLDEMHADGFEWYQRMNDDKRRLMDGDYENWWSIKRSMDSLTLVQLPVNVRAQINDHYTDTIKNLVAGLKKVSEVDAILKKARAMYTSKKSPHLKEMKHQLVELLMNAPQRYSRRLASRVVHQLLDNWNAHLAGAPGSLRTGSNKK